MIRFVELGIEIPFWVLLLFTYLVIVVACLVRGYHWGYARGWQAGKDEAEAEGPQIDEDGRPSAEEGR